MAEIEKIVLYTAAAGACIPLGGFLARIERLQPGRLEREFRHAIIAFGGGHPRWVQCWDSAWASWDMCWSSPEPGGNV